MLLLANATAVVVSVTVSVSTVTVVVNSFKIDLLVLLNSFDNDYAFCSCLHLHFYSVCLYLFTSPYLIVHMIQSVVFLQCGVTWYLSVKMIGGLFMYNHKGEVLISRVFRDDIG